MPTDNKLRQATDTIHGTIFLSGLESAMIATPYFFRLHDIYQSSTVYMTYPSNRTKRYEHSLGVMQLASRMLFSSVSNADDVTRFFFFEELNIRFNEVVKSALSKSNDMNVGGGYYQKLKDSINKAFYHYKADDIWDSISNARLIADDSSVFSELALDQYQYYPMIVDSSNESLKEVFLYRCLLQALRIVALFHDVGHPPFSHVIESALRTLFLETNRAKWDKDKELYFNESIEKFVANGESAFSCNTIYVNKSLNHAATHERIGFSLLQYALDDAISSFRSSFQSDDKSRTMLIYLICVAEFSMAIWAEKDGFFTAMHQIVDGIIDSDRLDYIMRDSRNSGVDWGDIPYERIITPMKLMKVENTLVFAFPKKLEEDIIDVLLLRYKLFARINYHHRCMKTAKALQTAVMLLSENYLSSTDKDINEDISILWRALSPEAGDKPLRIIQWNDSFLISTLHKSLVSLQYGEVEGVKNKQLIQDNLEEILLNKKKYISVIKRGQDCKQFSDLLFEKSNLTKEKLVTIKQTEFFRFCKSNGGTSPDFNEEDIAILRAANECDSVKRAQCFLDLMATGDLELFDSIGLTDSFTIMSDELEKIRNDGMISDYYLIKNEGRNKLGLRHHRTAFDEIYFYDSYGKISSLDENVSLKPKLSMMQKTVPWIYVYIAPSKSDFAHTVKAVFNRLAQAIANEIISNENMLFGVFTQEGEV